MKFGIGQPARRPGDQRPTTGTRRSTDDISLPTQTHAYFLRSPHAHARLGRINADTALGAPGVIGVVTGEDLNKAGIGPVPCMVPLRNRDGSDMPIPERTAI